MDNSKKQNPNQPGSDKEKKPKNAGSGGFNEGAKDDPNMNDGVADGTPNPENVSKEKENPKSGNIGKNNAGGWK